MPRLANYRSSLKLLSNYNNVENFSKEQFGYLGESLIVSDSILDAIIVHHMNSNNTNYLKSAPQIPNGAPMADFIYEDIMLRAEEIVQRYLCGEDELLATRSQMSRMILKHLKKYHGLLKSTAKEAKLALNKERKRKMIFTNASSNLSLANVSNMVTLKKEIEKKERELLRLNSTKNQNRSRKQQLNTILEQLKRRKKEVSNELKRVAPEKRSRAQNIAMTDALNDTGRTNYSSLLVNTYARLHPSTKSLISPVYQIKTGPKGPATTVFNYDEGTIDFTCASYPKITDSNTAHLVFSSHAFAPQLAPTSLGGAPGTKNGARFNATQNQAQAKKSYFLLQCEDTRVVSTSASDFEEWKSDPRASKLVPFKGVVESLNRKQIPFRTVFGDRLVKRRLVLHSFVERLNAALYLNYTKNNTRSELHPLYNRFSGLFLENMNKEVNNNSTNNSGVANTNVRTRILAKYGFTDDVNGVTLGVAGGKSSGAAGLIVEISKGAVLDTNKVRAMRRDLKVPEKSFSKTATTAIIKFAVPGSKAYAELTPEGQKSSSILFSLIKKGKNRTVGNVNTSTDDLLWNHQLRSFGTSGAQDYWIQLVREMYDNRRVENIRSKLRILNSKQKKNTPLKPQEVLTKFKDLNLGDNLGVTCYGYACNPRDPSAPWSTSYHRLGRSWFCSDINKDAFQLPFGCYSDKCAPPNLPVSHPNYHSSNGGTEPSRIKGDLELVTVNNICTTVLQPEAKHGTQGRYGHIKTAYRGQKIGKMSPSEALGVFTSIRQATGHDDDPTTAPYKIRLGLNEAGAKMDQAGAKPHQNGGTITDFKIQIVTGPKLEYSVLMSRKTLNINEPTESPLGVDMNAALSIPVGSTPSNRHENLSNNLLSKKNSENIYNVNKLKNQSNRHTALRKHLLGVSNEWNSATLGPKRVTGLNLDNSKLKNMGAGLKRSSKDVKMDTETLDYNFMMLDGDIFTGCGKKVDYLLHGGSERALGISKKFIDGPTSTIKPVIPLILPLNPGHGSYDQVKKRASIMFNNLLEDSTGGVAGLVQRQMENVCIPIFKSGSLLKGTHFNDLMDRFLSAVGDLEAKGENLELKLQSPKLYNIMKCIQFYLYLHVGLTTQEALTEIAKYQARRNAKAIQQDMFSLSTKLRLLGNTGPMPKKMFQKIVRQYLLTSKNNAYLQPEEVQSEIEELTNKLTSFKVLGRRFARQSFLPSFMGGMQKANKKMGIPSPGSNKKLKGTGTSFENLTDSAKNPVRTIKQLTKPTVGQKEKAMIGSGGNNRAIKNTNIRISPGNRVQQNARRRGASTARRAQNFMKPGPGNPSILNRASSPASYARGFVSGLAR